MNAQASIFHMTIAGEMVTSFKSMVINNPATGEPVGASPVCTVDQLDAAVGAAADSLEAWQRDEGARRAAFTAAGQLMREHAGELAMLLTAEQGKTMEESRQEVDGTADRFDYFASLSLPGEVVAPEANGGIRLKITHEPIGVVGVISPWNYPLVIAMNRVLPALLVGNTVILKPSPNTPLSTLRLGEVLRGVFPAGVLNVIAGDDALGSQLVEHPGVRAVSFTGSTRVGKLVAENAGRHLKRVLLELGGNDPAIILSDADVEATADGIVESALANCGQVCYNVKRVYAPNDKLDLFASAFLDRMAAVTIGDGSDPAVTLGPLNNAAQLARVEELVADAVAQGAKVLTGGKRVSGPGFFFEPTLLVDCNDSMRIVREEQFGPIIPLLGYDSIVDAVMRANASDYGLGASVWGADPDQVATIADQISAGSVWINCHGVVGPAQPHSGSRESAIGIVGGSELGLLGVSDLKVVVAQ